MNYFDTLIEVADDCPTKKAQVPLARGGKKTKAVVEYEILVKHPYSHTEEDIAFEGNDILDALGKVAPRERLERLRSWIEGGQDSGYILSESVQHWEDW